MAAESRDLTRAAMLACTTPRRRRRRCVLAARRSSVSAAVDVAGGDRLADLADLRLDGALDGAIARAADQALAVRFLALLVLGISLR